MIQELVRLFAGEGITAYGCLTFPEWRITYPSLLERTVPGAVSAVFFLIPYYVSDRKERNLSLYAVPRDYHLYGKDLGERLLPVLRNAYPDNRFALFLDHSPFDERYCAARAGLGMLGENGLLIHKKFGSYVFIAEIVSDMVLGENDAGEISHCPGCGACRRACPKKESCLSAVTQKKGVLSEAETVLIRQNGSAWGCDLCQTVCPFNKGAEETPIAFFREDLIWHLTSGMLNEMEQDAFSSRAYAWRKRETILRNLMILEKEENAAVPDAE